MTIIWDINAIVLLLCAAFVLMTCISINSNNATMFQKFVYKFMPNVVSLLLVLSAFKLL